MTKPTWREVAAAATQEPWFWVAIVLCLAQGFAFGLMASR